jgi:endonuclease IV
MPIAEIRNLTKQDVCVIWGGTLAVDKNETQIGLSVLLEFINSHKHTNVIIVTVPHRHDLEANSCVNNEVKTFIRKIKKCVKVYRHVSIIDVETNRGMFITHGLHLNYTGKEQVTTKVVKVIKDIFNGNQENILKLKWKKEGINTGEGSIDDHPQPQQQKGLNEMVYGKRKMK